MPNVILVKPCISIAPSNFTNENTENCVQAVFETCFGNLCLYKILKVQKCTVYNRECFYRYK